MTFETNRLTIFFAVILFTVGVILYLPLINIFYQQDEWQGLGHIFIEKLNHPFADMTFFQVLFGETRALARILGLLLFGLFPFETKPVAVFSIFFHCVNSVLVFYLFKKIFKNYFASLLSALFFLVNSVSSNAVSWFSTSVGTLPSATLILLALILFFKYLDEKKSTFKLTFFIFSLLYISLFFKEIGIYLFITLPFISLYFKTDKSIFSLSNIISKIKEFWYFLVFFILNTSYRIYELKTITTENALFITGSSNDFFLTILSRFIFYPLTNFSLTFIPTPISINLARGFTNLYYPFISPEAFVLVSETIVLDLLAAVATFLIFFAILLFINRSSSLDRRNILIFTALMFLSFAPYIIIGKTFSYLESRYFYLASAFGGIIFGYLFLKVYLNSIVFVRFLIIIFSILFLLVHSKITFDTLKNDEKISNERRDFLIQLKTLQPELNSNKNLFIIEGDFPYLLEGNYAPFQQGMGYTLMTWYYKKGKIPDKFLKEHFLWNLGSQGYKEEGNFGFGYYSDKDLFQKEINLSEKPDISFINLYYSTKSKELKRN